MLYQRAWEAWQACEAHYKERIAELERDAERLNWCGKNSAFPTQNREGLWCIDFSANGGKSWYDYKLTDCSETMREAIDKAMKGE